MKNDLRKNVILLIVSVVVIAVSALLAYGLERDFGKVVITKVGITDPNGVTLVGKLYRPTWVDVENPAPGILNLHGYQNDKGVQDSFSIELARRGFVVLALDAFGHGDSGGALGMNDDPTNGTNTGYLYLKSLPFVDPANLASMGHSMGGMESVAIGALNPDHKALNPHASLAGTPELNNVLVTQARYDEFGFFRENQPRTEELGTNETRLASLGLTGPVEWDTTYGDFDDGSARRMAYINMEHHFLTLHSKAIAEAVDWMRLALMGGETDEHWIDPTSQIYATKEFFGLITLFTALFSMIPLTGILLSRPYFAPVAQPIPNRYTASRKNWWVFATINMLIGGITYPILTQAGGFAPTIPFPTNLPFMKLQMGNGVWLWLLVNAIICGILFYFWYRSNNKKAGVTMYDMGVSFDEQKTKLDWGIIGKTVLLAFILFAWLYILEGISQWALGQEFRFAWPFMRQFSSPQRVGLFFIYLIPALLFFLINGGVFLFGQARQKEHATPAKTQWMWWLKNLYAALFGLLLVLLFQYIPWVALGQGPGFENVGLAQYSGIWPLMLLVYIPEFIVLLFFLTWFYRKTGRIYLGAIMISALMIWFLAAGSIIGA